MQLCFKPKILSNYTEWVYYRSAFSEHECKLIRSLFKNYEQAKMIYDNANSQKISDSRSSLISWLAYGPETDWIFKKISEYVNDCNDVRYNFDLIGFNEPLQLTKYSVNDHFDWHQDMGATTSWRKISVVVQLSPPSEYDGGTLEFLGHDAAAPNELGDLIMFPSYISHRVAPVIKGERFSLVAWVYGPPYR